MFNNIGNKIKVLAQFFCYAGIALSIFLGIRIILSNNKLIFALLLIILGSIVSWISSFILYGFGQLIDNSDILVRKIHSNSFSQHSPNQIDQMSATQLSDISCKNFNTHWYNGIKALSDEQLKQKINDQSYEYNFRVMCQQELNARIKQQTP